MLDTMQDRLDLLRACDPSDDEAAGADTLRDRCLHPAELWVLKRRASRPCLASHRLPAVARAG